MGYRRSQIVLDASEIGGKCLEMRIKGFSVASGGQWVYSALYNHSGTTADHEEAAMDSDRNSSVRYFLAVLAFAAGCEAAGTAPADAASTSDSGSADGTASSCLLQIDGTCPEGCGRVEVAAAVDQVQECHPPFELRVVACGDFDMLAGAIWCYQTLDGSEISQSPGIYPVDAAHLAAQGWKECDEATRMKLLTWPKCSD